MDSYNSYLSDIQSSMGQANTLQEKAIAKTQAEARKQQEEQEPLNLLGAELLTGGIKGVRQRFIKKVGQKVAEKTGSKSLGKFVEDVGGGRSLEDSARTATQGAVDSVTKKAEGAVNKVTSEAQNIARQAKQARQTARAKAREVIEPPEQEDQIRAKPVENIKLDTLPEQEGTFNPRPKRRVKQAPPEPEPEPELDPIEAEREGYGKDLLAPENQPFYTDSDIDTQLQKEAQKRALGDVKPPDRALENIKPYNKPENIKKAQQQQEQRDNEPVETQEEAQPKFDDPSTLPPPIADEEAIEPYDPTQELEGEFKGTGGQFKRGGLTIEAGEEQDKGLPALRDVTQDEHLENIESLSDKDYQEYQERSKGLSPLDYSKKTQIIDDIKERPARATAEARESLGLDKEPEEEPSVEQAEQFEPEEPDPFKGSVENPLTEAEAPAPPPPRPTVEEAPPPPPEQEEAPPPPPPEETEAPPPEEDEPPSGDIEQIGKTQTEQTAIKTTEKTGLEDLTADSSVFDENPLGDIVTAGLGLASLLVPLFSHAPKESPVNPINPSSQFGES